MIERQLYTEHLKKYINTPFIKIITGIRRSGKSYLLKLLKADLIQLGIPSENIILLNFESLIHEDIKNYKMLYHYVDTLISNLEGKCYILLDEIQEVLDWELALKSFLVDFNCDVYITGSNANLLSSELATYLSGRYVELSIYPLSFNEYLNFLTMTEWKNTPDVNASFYDYLKYGGFPALHFMLNDEDLRYQYLKGIYNSVLLKDVIQRNNIRDSELLERIIRFTMDNIGNILSAKKISDFLKNQGRKLSTETVYNYLAALEQAFVLYKVSRYDLKGKKILETQEKYYVSDLGLRHALIGYHDNDISGLLENIVYLELLRRGFQVYIGKQGDLEVDFVAIKNDNRLYIQVTYLLASESTIEREYAPLLQISDNYEKIVLSLDSYFPSNRDGIKWINLIHFLNG